MRASVFEVSETAHHFGHRQKPDPDWDPGLEENRFFEKTGPQVSKTSPFFSSNIKDNVKNIHFHVKRRGVQGQDFVPITFENCTLNFYFENGEFGIKKTIANLQPLLAWNVSACLRIFMQPCFQ